MKATEIAALAGLAAVVVLVITFAPPPRPDAPPPCQLVRLDHVGDGVMAPRFDTLPDDVPGAVAWHLADPDPEAERSRDVLITATAHPPCSGKAEAWVQVDSGAVIVFDLDLSA